MLAPASNHKSTLLLGRARIHVAAAVEVVVDLGRRADHAPVQEDIEGGGLQVLFSQRAGAVVLPEHREQKRRDDGIDIDAEHVAASRRSS